MTSLSLSALEPESDVLRDVRIGLTKSQKELPPKYFYDHRGSLLFEAITGLPEYYLTRAERRLLLEWMPSLMRVHKPVVLVELGAGSGEKTRLILRAMRDAGRGKRYVPMDVSADFLEDSAGRMRTDLPWLEVEPVVADFTVSVPPRTAVDGPALFAFLGSTLGNLDTGDAISLLRNVRAAMRPGDRFLLGADLRTKPVERIELAYNDSQGITEDFNLNMLRVINRELGADFHLPRFGHRAFWSWAQRRIEMHLVVRETHHVSIPGLGPVRFREGESIRTEICNKYDRPQLAEMLRSADLVIETWRVDPQDQYAILVAAPGVD
jgi:L-histidine N-alpha-methyltransferase